MAASHVTPHKQLNLLKRDDKIILCLQSQHLIICVYELLLTY